MFIYDVLQHYYDERCSPESWSLLLMSLLAENNRGARALRQSVKKYHKRHETCQMFIGVLSLTDTKA